MEHILPAKPTLRQLIDLNRPAIGAMCFLPSSHSVEVQCESGAEFLFIDTEHSAIDRTALVTMLQAADISATPVIVRAAWNNPELVGWPIDFGAQGIMVPMVNSAKDAEKLVNAARYPPLGERSWGAVRQMYPGYDTEVGNQSTVCLALIETREGFEAIEAITSVEGLDAVWAGQSDLGIAFGLHPSRGRTNIDHLRRLETIAAVCIKNGVATFANCADLENARRLHDMGYRFLIVGSDLAHIMEGAREGISAARKAMGLAPA